MKEKISNVAVIVNPVDNVATAVRTIEAGTELIKGKSAIILKAQIQTGHKFALADIAKGAEILKYGAVIGRAVSDIASGEWVHVHNIEGCRGRGDVKQTAN